MSDAGEKLRQSACAVKLSFRWFGNNRELDDAHKELFAASYHANARRLKAKKQLINSKNQYYRALTKISGDIKKFKDDITLPYVERGLRLIKKDDLVYFMSEVVAKNTELHLAAAAFMEHLPEIQTESSAELGDLFDSADYEVDFKEAFNVDAVTVNVEPPSYLMQLDPQLYQAECARVRVQFERAAHLKEQHFAQKFHELLDHLVDRMKPGEDGKPKKFHESNLTNLHQFFAKCKHFDVTGQAGLAALVDSAEKSLQGVDVASLKADPTLKEKISSSMEQIKGELAKHIKPVVKRKLSTLPANLPKEGAA